jgi:hypothetical protein
MTYRAGAARGQYINKALHGSLVVVFNGDLEIRANL